MKLTDLLADIYRTRYDEKAEKLKGEYWEILCSDFLQKFVRDTDTVMDIAAGHCEFINNIRAKTKYALDIDPRVKKYAGEGVKVLLYPAEKIPHSLNNSIDVIFMGCFLEHLPSKDAVISVFENCRRVLKRGGRLLILNPNIRFSTSDYWDYFDHLTAVSDRSVAEVLEALGFGIDVLLPKFVPNTIRDRLPKNPVLVRIYLHLPFLFPVFGKQMFIAARRI